MENLPLGTLPYGDFIQCLSGLLVLIPGWTDGPEVDHWYIKDGRRHSSSSSCTIMKLKYWASPSHANLELTSCLRCGRGHPPYSSTLGIFTEALRMCSQSPGVGGAEVKHLGLCCSCACKWLNRGCSYVWVKLKLFKSWVPWSHHDFLQLLASLFFTLPLRRPLLQRCIPHVGSNKMLFHRGWNVGRLPSAFLCSAGPCCASCFIRMWPAAQTSHAPL